MPDIKNPEENNQNPEELNTENDLNKENDEINPVSSTEEPIAKRRLNTDNSDSSSKKEKKSMKIFASVYEWLDSFALALLVVMAVLLLLGRYVTVEGSSMRETLHDGDKIVISAVYGDIKPGDVIVIKSPAHNEPIIKRVIAVGGQQLYINFEDWSVWVDGKRVYEDYINRDINYDGINDDGIYPMRGPNGVKEMNYTVEEGMLFVMGDNRNHSDDSRNPAVGPIEEYRVLGKAVFRFFPFSGFGAIK